MSECPKYDLYCVYSKSSLNTIKNSIENNGSKVILSRIHYDRIKNTNDYKETNRTLLLISGENVIINYKHKIFDTSNTVLGRNPTILTLNTNQSYLDEIEDKLNLLTVNGFIDIGDWIMNERDDGATIHFNENVDDRKRGIIKEMLDSPPYYRVSWLRDIYHKGKNKRNGKAKND